MKEDIKTAITALIKKAGEAQTGLDAQAYAQAAQTLAYVLQNCVHQSPPSPLL